MLEAAVAVAVVLVLLASAGGEGIVTLLFVAGAAAVLIGMLAGVPAGVVYHVLLFRSLSEIGILPRRWWWHPTTLHDRLPEAARRRLMRWFRAGAAGFVLAMIGCGLILGAVLVR
ncbi:MAG TPA: hypothetical protein VI078_17890 [bacterium]